jgi:hypothetical protein
MLRVRKKMQSEDIDLFGHLAQSVFARRRSLPAISDGSGDCGEEDVLRAGQSPQPKGDGRRGMTTSVTDVVCVRVPLTPVMVNA